MKSYTFAKVSARGYLTEADRNNKSVITEDLGLIINVTEHSFAHLMRPLREKGIKIKQFTLSDEGKMNYKLLLNAVRHLLYWDRKNKRSIVFSFCGINRSRTVVEAFHYAKMGYHLEDEYQGFKNHLIYNCECGNLPSLSAMEYFLGNVAKIQDEIDPDMLIMQRLLRPHQ